MTNPILTIIYGTICFVMGCIYMHNRFARYKEAYKQLAKLSISLIRQRVSEIIDNKRLENISKQLGEINIEA